MKTLPSTSTEVLICRMNHSFFGARTILRLVCCRKPEEKLKTGYFASIRGLSLGCFAARELILNSQDSVELGIPSPKSYRPFRIFAPLYFEITAPHVTLDNIEIVDPRPLAGRIVCDHLKLFKDPLSAKPVYFDLIKSWIQGTPEIEIVNRSQPTQPCPAIKQPPLSESPLADVLQELFPDVLIDTAPPSE